MLQAWSRFTREQRRPWNFVLGALAVGTVVKVAYFTVSRKMMVRDAERIHKEGMEHLREAREFAEWSQKDRDARLPKLTEEQHRQMQEYLQLVGKHGLSKTLTEDGAKECLDCPIMTRVKQVVGGPFSAAAGR
ncbi:hypothetical protein FisN_4Hu402 [Fistulifera solaris]|uniref:Uncharacterized protein n=1 Tax=Fistulifera solaris TaxID=1519565 RepID=A0A1Z5KQF8_FISSO|nr:hypothetical protein FisN_4Hu402 [Fistulifera solaris]|eukprot:GAX28407.1 hypothetical protein FisN_4Hu402 [Fistulifera solaris]